MTKYIIILISLIIAPTHSFGQNDTLYLRESYCILKGDTINRIVDSTKVGDWYEYTIDNTTITSLLWDGIDKKTGESISGSYRIEKEYRHLTELEKKNKNSLTRVVSENLQIEVTDKVPSNYFFISGSGFYKKGQKEGLWNYYYKNGEIKKSIEFKNGKPSKKFKYFDDKGRIKMIITPKDNDGYLINKYDEEGKLLNSKLYSELEAKIIIK